VFSELTEEIIATTYEDERRRIYFKDKAMKPITNCCKASCWQRDQLRLLDRR
jgi:hypothetical protein